MLGLNRKDATLLVFVTVLTLAAPIIMNPFPSNLSLIHI